MFFVKFRPIWSPKIHFSLRKDKEECIGGYCPLARQKKSEKSSNFAAWLRTKHLTHPARGEVHIPLQDKVLRSSMNLGLKRGTNQVHCFNPPARVQKKHLTQWKLHNQRAAKPYCSHAHNSHRATPLRHKSWTILIAAKSYKSTCQHAHRSNSNASWSISRKISSASCHSHAAHAHWCSASIWKTLTMSKISWSTPSPSKRYLRAKTVIWPNLMVHASINMLTTRRSRLWHVKKLQSNIWRTMYISGTMVRGWIVYQREADEIKLVKKRENILTSLQPLLKIHARAYVSFIK